MSDVLGVPYNTAVVAVAVAAVGFAAGVVGSFGVLRRRALVGDAASHATLVGVVGAFLVSGRRDLPVLLAGGFVAALASLACIVMIRRVARTRDDAATAIVLGVSYGLGIALLSGLSARGIPGVGGLEHFLMGHTAALTAGDAATLAIASAVAVLLVWLGLKEATLVAFDPDFAAACGWPVALIDYALIALVAVMVVVGLPAAGAVLVTALVVIPAAAARQWTDRVESMLLLAGGLGLVAALGGVAASAAVPRLPTGPSIVLVAAALFALSFFFAPQRGWLSRRRTARDVARAWTEGCVLTAALEAADAGDGLFTRPQVDAGSSMPRAAAERAWEGLVRRRAIVPVVTGGAGWRLSPEGRSEARERRRRLDAWQRVLEERPADARAFLTIDVPAPEIVRGDDGPDGNGR